MLTSYKISDFEEDGFFKIEEVIKQYNIYLYKMMTKLLNDKEDVEEILSDIFLILWKNHERLNKDMEIKPYLIGIAKNLIKKKYRYNGRNKLTQEIEMCENEVYNNIDILELLENNEKAKIVLEAIESMKYEEKEIFIMFYYKSRKVKEISKELKISESKVKVTLYRLRKDVRKKLNERGYSYG